VGSVAEAIGGSPESVQGAAFGSRRRRAGL